jgi:hypothetical protein
MIKNKKGQISLTIMLIGFSLMTLLLASTSYISSLEIRNTNKMNNKQLNEISSGGVYYAMSLLKKQIDYQTLSGQLLPYQFPFKDGIAEFDDTISIYKPTDPQYNTALSQNYVRTGAFQDVMYLNYAQDVCFQITWDKDITSGTYAPVTIKIDRAITQPDNSIAYSPIQLPYTESDGNIGFDPKFCNPGMNNPAMIPSRLMYDPVNNMLINGYGAYRITVSVVGNAPNLQTIGLYNRLSYRTFEIKSSAKINDKLKNNTRVLVQATYDANFQNVIPKFKFIRWYEGDE